MGGSVICVSAYVCVVLCAVGVGRVSVISIGKSNASLYNIAKINKYSEFVVEGVYRGVYRPLYRCLYIPHNSFLISSLISYFLTHFLFRPFYPPYTIPFLLLLINTPIRGVSLYYLFQIHLLYFYMFEKFSFYVVIYQGE